MKTLLELIASMPTGWEVRIGPEHSPEEGRRFLAATVFSGDEREPGSQVEFGVSALDGDTETLERLLTKAIERRRRSSWQKV